MSGPAGGIFISYRRGEASYIAGRLYDQLADRFGDDRVFIDVDNVELGIDFAKAVTQAVSTSEVLLVVIGPHWHTAIDADGNRRLDDPDDIVRLEIEAALQRDIRVIPILIEGAVMPRRGQLPEGLAGLAHRNALVLRYESFRSDVTRLMEAIDRLFRVTAVHVFGHPGVVNGVAFSPDGRLLATSSDDEKARIWDLGERRQRREVDHEDRVWAVAFSPDGTVLATGSDDNTARLWEVATGHERLRVTHDHWVWAVGFSPNGRRLGTASWDRTARVWDVATGQEHLRVVHDETVRAIAFSRDGRWLVTGSWDGTARVWDIATGGERLRLPHDDAVNGVAVSADGRWVATASLDSTARLWDLVE